MTYQNCLGSEFKSAPFQMMIGLRSEVSTASFIKWDEYWSPAPGLK